MSTSIVMMMYMPNIYAWNYRHDLCTTNMQRFFHGLIHVVCLVPIIEKKNIYGVCAKALSKHEVCAMHEYIPTMSNQ